MHDHAPVEQRRDRSEHEQREQLLREDVETVQRSRKHGRVAEAREETARDYLRRADREHDESPEHRRVKRTRDRIAEDLRLTDADHDEIADPCERMAGAIVGQAHRQHVAHQPLCIVREERQREYDYRDEDDVSGRQRASGARDVRALTRALSLPSLPPSALAPPRTHLRLSRSRRS